MTIVFSSWPVSRSVVHHAADLIVDVIDHRPVGRANQTLIAIAHVFRGEAASPATPHALAIDPLILRLVVQLARLIRRQGDFIESFKVGLEKFARRIERVVRVLDVAREKPRAIEVFADAHEVDGALGDPAGVARLGRHPERHMFAAFHGFAAELDAVLGQPGGVLADGRRRRVHRPVENAVAVVGARLAPVGDGWGGRGKVKLARVAADVAVVGQEA